MRYVGRCVRKDESHVSLRCGKCKKVHAYETLNPPRDEKKCALCGTRCRFAFFAHFNPRILLSWFPPIFMTAFFALILYLLLFSPFLQHFQFNRFVTTSNSLLTSIVIPVIGSVVSILPAIFTNRRDQLPVKKHIPLIVVLFEVIVLIFVMNNIIEANFNSLMFNNPVTGEPQQYFGTVIGTVASGKGRLFDHRGNLIYCGGFSNNKYDGYGIKYEQINSVHNSQSVGEYECVYEGEFSEGEYNGQGKEYRYDAEYTFEKEPGKSAQLYYEGGFQKGKHCGYGTLYEVTIKHEGGFFDGTYNGYGTQWFLNDNETYRMEGYYKDGNMNGHGTKYYPNGQTLFEGEYVDGKVISGQFYFENGTLKYDGGVQSDKYHGSGTLYWENGNIRYKGDWNEGMRQGKGTSYSENTGLQTYSGSWQENEWSGYGIQYYNDGVTPQYVGFWNNSQENGWGVKYYEYSQNEEYKMLKEGNWVNGRLNGNGTSYYENGEVQYTGGWSNDRYSGEGEWNWDNGQLYFKGHFENDKIEGYGTTYNRDGIRVYEGDISGNNSNGYGTLYWENQIIHYQGDWKEGKYSGMGKEYSKDGELLHEGSFLNGEFIP